MVKFKVDNVIPENIDRLKTINGKEKAFKLNQFSEGCSHLDTNFIETTNLESLNPFVQSWMLAFSHHYPITLSPDVIFNVIMQGVSTHINKNAEKYRTNFVDHCGQKKLFYRDDFLKKGNFNNNWSNMIDNLSQQILVNLVSEPVKNILNMRFTTTDHAAMIAHKGVFMDVVKKYFSYYCMTMCGIPWIEVLGVKEDWIKLKLVLSHLLNALDLQLWNNDIEQILDQFISVFDGKIEKDFWSRAYNYHGPQGSGGTASLSGWVANLFLYLKHGINANIGHLHLPLKNTNGKTTSKNIPLADFNIGLTSTPFQWLYFDQQFNMNLHSGLIGISKTIDGALKPELGWIVSENNEPREHLSMDEAMKIWSESTLF